MAANKPETEKVKALKKRVEEIAHELYKIGKELDKVNVRKLIFEDDKFWGEPDHLDEMKRCVWKAWDEL